MFKFYNVQPATDGTDLTFQVSQDGGSTYGRNMVSATTVGYINEAGTSHNLYYETTTDLPTGGSGAGQTNYQMIATNTGNDADQACNGTLIITVPSKTDRFKPWWSNMLNAENANHMQELIFSGIVYQTAAINAIDFKFSSGNIATGTIKMWGIK